MATEAEHGAWLTRAEELVAGVIDEFGIVRAATWEDLERVCAAQGIALEFDPRLTEAGLAVTGRVRGILLRPDAAVTVGWHEYFHVAVRGPERVWVYGRDASEPEEQAAQHFARLLCPPEPLLETIQPRYPLRRIFRLPGAGWLAGDADGEPWLYDEGTATATAILPEPWPHPRWRANLTFYVRSIGNPPELIDTVREVIRRFDLGQEVADAMEAE